VPLPSPDAWRRSAALSVLILSLAAARPAPADTPRTAAPSAEAPSAAAAPAPAPSGEGVFNPETFTLPNGMQVVVVNNPRVPVLTHMVWYKVGAADEEEGKSGIAHFLEHLMFKGTDELAPGEFSRIVARNGGRDNAFTSWDYTAYFQNVASDRLELVMKMEADRMADLQLTDEAVLPERDVVREERRQRTDNEPGSRLSEQVNATLFVHHPYGRPIIGWDAEVSRLDREDAQGFYKKWYAPNNAVLVVAGDVTAEALRPLAEKYYGAIPAREVPERRRVDEPPLEAERRVILRDPEVRQPAYRKLFLAPSYRRGETRHAYPLQVLSEILGGGATSRLYRELTVEKRLATGAASGYSPTSYDLSVFGLYASPTPETPVEELEEALNGVVAELLDKGVTAEEVETAKKRLEREAIFARDSLQGPAQTFGATLATGGTVEEVETWPERIAAVTVEEVNEAARAVLGQSGFVVGLLLPHGEDVRAAGAPAARPAAQAPASTDTPAETVH
jgi:zinc protease